MSGFTTGSVPPRIGKSKGGILANATGMRTPNPRRKRKPSKRKTE